jgi:diguanylate cyclase (GGDEF)-like protein
VAGSPLMTVVAAACSLGAGACSVALVHRARQAEHAAAAAAAAAPAPLAQGRPAEARAAGRSASLIDAETRLPDGRYFEICLGQRVAAARRHLWPVTVVLVELSRAGDDVDRAETLATVAHLLGETLREADTICRIGPATFALVLDDTAEAGGVWAAERLQVAATRQDPALGRMTAGVASYPAHGLEADEVLRRARAALARACSTEPDDGLGRVEVAKADLTWESN